MPLFSGRLAAALALLLTLSSAAAPALAGSSSPTKIPSVAKLEPATADGGESLAREAIRVPAFGTSQPTAMTLAESGPSKPAARPRKRVAPRRIMAIDAPPPAYWRPLHYRFGYGYGPGLRLYRW